MTDLSDVGVTIEEFAVALTLKRRAASTIANGIATAGAETSVSFSGVVVPAAGKTMERVPQGRRSEETIQVFTRTEITVADTTGAKRADVVVWRGRQYEATSVRPWTAGGFWDAVCTRVGQ